MLHGQALSSALIGCALVENLGKRVEIWYNRFRADRGSPACGGVVTGLERQSDSCIGLDRRRR